MGFLLAESNAVAVAHEASACNGLATTVLITYRYAAFELRLRQSELRMK